MTDVKGQKTSLLDQNMTAEGKMKIPNPNFTASYTQSYTRTPKNVNAVHMTSFTKKYGNVVFQPSFDPSTLNEKS